MEARQTLDFLNIQYRCLIKVGLVIGAIRGKVFIKSFWKVVCYSIISSYIQYCQIVEVLHIFKVSFAKATTVLTTFNQACLLMLKVMVIVLNSHRMLTLIWNINLLATGANQPENNVWVSENTRSLLISKVYATACGIAVFYAGMLPIMQILYQYFQGSEIVLRLPFGGEYPFADRGIEIFILNYILSVIHMRTCLHLTIGLDTLFGWFVHSISGHFRILRIKIEAAATKIEVNDNHYDFVKDVGCIVRCHVKILGFIDEFNNVFAGYFLAKVLFSCMQLCFVICSLNYGEDIQTMALNVMVFAAVTMQMMIYCFGGEKLKTEKNGYRPCAENHKCDCDLKSENQCARNHQNNQALNSQTPMCERLCFIVFLQYRHMNLDVSLSAYQRY